MPEPKTRIHVGLHWISLMERLGDLGRLTPARHGNGGGSAFPRDGVDWLAECFVFYWPAKASLPWIFPTPEGKVSLEWVDPIWSLTMEIDLSSRIGSWHSLNTRTDEELSRDVDLSNQDGWQWVLEQLLKHGMEDPHA
jgi:hypothetical protein